MLLIAVVMAVLGAAQEAAGPPRDSQETARVRGVVTDQGIDISGDDVDDVEVVVTANPSRIAGVVVDGSQRPVAGAGVVVFPADPVLWGPQPNRRIASATTDGAGSFEIFPLPAGEYLVAVVDELIDGEWAEPDYLESIRARSAKVVLGDAERQVVTLRR